MYYLQSRYYNPEWGRFINSDGLLESGHEVLGNNLYIYCNNNPINNIDEDGTIGRLIFAIVKIVAVVALVYAVATLINTNPEIGENIGTAIEATVNGISGIASQIKTETKTEAKTKTVTQTKTKKKKETVIYRRGGTNPSNLYPKRSIDVKTGLSFTSIPQLDVKSIKTTVEAVNRTGVLEAINDRGNHYKIIPTKKTLQQWHDEGPGSELTITLKSIVTKNEIRW